MTENLLHRIRLRLDGAGFPGLRRVQVRVDQGVIVLDGRLGTYHEKQMAMELIRHVAGVLRVENQIEVESGRPSVRIKRQEPRQ